MGCGACYVVCPVGAIQLTLKKGQYYPVVDEKCIKCNGCLDVCPGIKILLRQRAEKMWPENELTPELGRWKQNYIGYSTNETVRFSSASGGIATALVSHMLDQRMIQGAILTKMSESDPLRAESFIARTVQEMISAQGSKYCPTSPMAVLDQLKTSDKGEKLAFVGLPCQIHALRKLQQREVWAREKIIISLGLFCGHGITSFGFDVVLQRLAKGTDNIEMLRYRGRGWPGNVCVRYKNGDECTIAHNEYWPPFFAPYFFTPYRCLTCPDLTSELADISLGDAWLGEVTKHDSTGTSIIIVRSKSGKEIIANAAEHKKVFVEETSYQKVIKSQKGMLDRKKCGVGSRMLLFRFLLRPVPMYDHKFLSHPRYYLAALFISLNAFISKLKVGQKLLRILPIKLIKLYSDYILMLAQRKQIEEA